MWEGIPWPYPRKVVDAGLAMQDTDTGFFSRNSDGTAGDPMVRAPAVTICSAIVSLGSDGCCASLQGRVNAWLLDLDCSSQPEVVISRGH